jgi:hypothetical protein
MIFYKRGTHVLPENLAKTPFGFECSFDPGERLHAPWGLWVFSLSQICVSSSWGKTSCTSRKLSENPIWID